MDRTAMKTDQIKRSGRDGRHITAQTAPETVSSDVITEHRRRVERSDEVDCFDPIVTLPDVTANR